MKIENGRCLVNNLIYCWILFNIAWCRPHNGMHASQSWCITVRTDLCNWKLSLPFLSVVITLLTRSCKTKMLCISFHVEILNPHFFSMPTLFIHYQNANYFGNMGMVRFFFHLYGWICLRPRFCNLKKNMSSSF